MLLDVSECAGFPLTFDPDLLQISTSSDMVFEKKMRKARDQKHVLVSPEAIDPDTEVYHLYYPQKFPAAAQAALDLFDLTYSLVLIPPLQIGGEFVKTTGHYHPPIPGTLLPFPEVYTQLYGTLHLLLQKRHPDNLEVQDCQLVEMVPGFSITIPPGYAHILINTTQEPALMAGLYGRKFKPDYQPIQAKRGLAYYLLADRSTFTVQKNPLYKDAPPLQRLTDPQNTHFAYADEGIPVWTSFLNAPEQYAFLTQPDAVMKKFGTVVRNE